MEGTITNTLFEGLNEKTIQAKVDSIDAKPFLFGTHFPVKKVNAFMWKTLMSQITGRNVAADVKADNATTQRKKRPVFQSATGDIPHLSISRDMKRNEIKVYQVSRALANGNPNALELLDFWANDVEFCFTGIQAELEFIAWVLASNAGVLKFTNQNNAAIATEFDLDYQVDTWQKMKVAVSFENATTADILGAFKAAVKAGKEKGSNIKYAFTSIENFYRIATSEQVIKRCASYVQNLTGTPLTPDLATINAMLAKETWMNGLQLIIVDQTITRELSDGSQTSANPFIDHRIVFSETPKLGSTQYDILQSENPMVLKAVRSHTVIKKFGTAEPLSEITIGEADAIPVFDTAYKNIYLKTDAKNW